ncbi:MAG: prolyl oligopeptidase [Chlamydiales bacterium]|jgi:prolyl oligopeptidase
MMTLNRLAWIGVTLNILGCSSTDDAQRAPRSAASISYPAAAHGAVVEDYHGTQVADPYRWLEDSDAPESRTWIEAQNALTESWLAAIPGRDRIHDRLEALWTYERFGIPSKHGDAYFFSYNDGYQSQSVICRAQSLESEREVVLDPNSFSSDGTVSLGGTAWSEDGNYLAYGLSDGGSDWRTWHVRDLRTGKDLDDRLEWVKFSSPTWSHDGLGFYYGRYPATENKLQAENLGQQLYYHLAGTEQAADVLVFEDAEHPKRGCGAGVSEDGKLLMLNVWEGSARKNRLYFQDLMDPDASVIRALDDFDAAYTPIGSDGWIVYLSTDKDAPRGRVVSLDVQAAGAGNVALVEIVPEGAEVLQNASIVGGRLVLSYLSDAKTRVEVREKDGREIRQVGLPGIGTASGFGGKEAASASETFYAFSSYTQPTALYRYDVASGESTLYKRPEVPFDGDAYETRQVFFESPDGTRVPMFITARKGLELDGSVPTQLYGYGGFNISLRPSFSPAVAGWLDMGGVYAVANLRGGGEYGREWHLAGTREHKQNVFDDFIAAAEWLIEAGYTSSEHLAISGGSNGGLLVGACMTQRPDLFAAALPAVGVLDMLRYHLFTIGWAWASDYGTSEEEDMFPTLLAYSPLHNLESGVSYPATLVTTGDHDDRVVPGHSFKFAASLQEAQGGDRPTMIRIETRAGHGAGKSREQRIEEATDRWTFLLDALGMKLPF